VSSDNIFVKIDAVTGTATGAHHRWLKALSFSLAKPPGHTLTLVRLQDAASPTLYQLAIEGASLGKVIIELERTRMRIELSDVLIGAMHVGSDSLTEDVLLDFTGIKTVAPVQLVGAAAIEGAVAGSSGRLKRKQSR
jgi:type VI protein secretion system component Hcp